MARVHPVVAGHQLVIDRVGADRLWNDDARRPDRLGISSGAGAAGAAVGATGVGATGAAGMGATGAAAAGGCGSGALGGAAFGRRMPAR